MTLHLNDGQIRAALDGELEEQWRQHLDGCPQCQQRLLLLQNEVLLAKRRLAFLSQPESRPIPAASTALARFKNNQTYPKEIPMLQKIFSSRLIRVGAAVAVLLALVLSVPSTRAWAGQFLGLFRVQQITVLPIDATGIEQLNGNSAMTKQIGQMISKSVEVTHEPGEPKAAANAAEASQMAGFRVRLPEAADQTPVITVTDGAAFNFKTDRAKVQALLDEAGRKDLVLPESVDGANISVEIPASVRAAYGTCPDLTRHETIDPDTEVTPASRFPDCIILAQLPSPVVNTPPDMNIQQLAEIALEFIGMTPDEAQKFSQTIDWTTSLVVPIPINAATNRQVNVDGVTGTLIERPADDSPEFLLMWVKDGIVYAMAGLGNQADRAIELANTIQ